MGHLTFVALDARAYVATGTCGIATGDGAARGDASYVLRLRGEGSSLRRAKLASTSGAIRGSLDGVHSYRGDCRLHGRGVEDGAVPASLRRASASASASAEGREGVGAIRVSRSPSSA